MAKEDFDFWDSWEDETGDMLRPKAIVPSRSLPVADDGPSNPALPPEAQAERDARIAEMARLAAHCRDIWTGQRLTGRWRRGWKEEYLPNARRIATIQMRRSAVRKPKRRKRQVPEKDYDH